MSLIESDLAELKEHVLRMGGEVESMIERAMKSLTERDSTLAEEVLEDDDRIDLLELEGDQTCVRVLALKSPEARDLRFVISAAKLTPILERIADHACNVARAALELNNEPQLKPYIDLPRMSDIARGMLRDSLEAFAASDAVAARAVIERDDEIDTLYHTIFHDLLDIMAEDPAAAARAARLVLVAKHLERIGDYVTDICELIVFMKEARVIKHSGELTRQ
jgi:phosphate transport system protein